MARTKGAKNKKQIPAREKYWRAVLGVDRATNDVVRGRRVKAKKEQIAEDAAWAAEAESVLRHSPRNARTSPQLNGSARAGQAKAD